MKWPAFKHNTAWSVKNSTSSNLQNKPYPYTELFPASINISNRNTRTRCEICSKLTTIKTPERRHQLPSGVCNLWTYFTPCFRVSIVNFEHVIAGWDYKGTIISHPIPYVFWPILNNSWSSTPFSNHQFYLQT